MLQIRPQRRLLMIWTATAMLPVAAQPKPIASRELDLEGFVAEVIEAVRKDGVLSVRVRFRNDGGKATRLSLVDTQGYVNTYVVSGDTKYPLMKDSAGRELATPRDGGGWLEPTIKPKGSWTWWGKFPAPPAGRSQFTLFFKVGPPIEDIAITDRP